MKIKVCGITREEDFRLLADSGLIDYAGFIFHKDSPRYISPEFVKDITENKKGKLKTVGVFVNTEARELKKIKKCANLDIVQLHGKESPEFCDDLRIPYWKVIRPDTSKTLTSMILYNCQTILLDSFSTDKYGGTGTRIPETYAKEALRFNKEIILAGGITPSDISVLHGIGFHGVDINSSVESSPGIKDHNKLRKLFRIVERINEQNRN